MKYMLFILILFSSLLCRAEFRIWEDNAGNIWEGEFVTVNAGKVVIRDRTGEKKSYSPGMLSGNDLVYLEKKVPPRLELTVSKSSDNGSSSKSEIVKCRAVITKKDGRAYSGEMTAVLVVLAKDQKSGSFSKAGASKEFSFTLPQKPGASVEFESSGVGLAKSSASSGRVYAGYVLVVWDRFGNPIAVESSHESVLDRAPKLARPKLKTDM